VLETVNEPLDVIGPCRAATAMLVFPKKATVRVDPLRVTFTGALNGYPVGEYRAQVVLTNEWYAVVPKEPDDPLAEDFVASVTQTRTKPRPWEDWFCDHVEGLESCTV